MKTNNRKINFVDVLLTVTLVIVLAVFVSVFFKNNSQIDFSKKEPITLTMRIKNIPIKHSGLIKSGDNVYFSENEKDLGKIKYVGYDSETVEFLDKLTNTSTTYKSPDKNTALILIEAQAELIDDDYVISGQTVRKSETVSAFVSTYAFDATIINIENNNKE